MMPALTYMYYTCSTHTHTQPLSKTFVPGPKDIKVLCADDEPTALSWTAGIRLAKYGLQLRDNFHKAKMTQFKLEDLTVGDGTRHTAGVSSICVVVEH